jgi:hypothetical protein
MVSARAVSRRNGANASDREIVKAKRDALRSPEGHREVE